MRTNWLMLLSIVVLVISTRIKLVDSTSETRHDETHSQTNLQEQRTMGREQETSSSKSFFGFLDIFPHFFRKGSPPSVKNRRNNNQELPSSYHAPSSFNNDRTLSKSGSSERMSLSENNPRAMIRARDFRLSTSTEQERNSRISDGSTLPSAVPSLTTSRQSVIGMENNAAVGHSTIRTGIPTRQSDAGTFQTHGEGQYEWSPGDFKSKSKLHLDRQEILLPAMGTTMYARETASQEGKRIYRKRIYHENINPFQVSGRIRAYAEKVSSIPRGKTSVKIGEASFPQEKVAIVGDVDGNEVQDYIVTNTAANNHSGTVRLYLMGGKDIFLYTRELVPGKWGFEAAALKPGDRFGETVFRLPSASNSSQCFVAIAAPGDQTMKDTNGAVYILEVSRKGNVNNHTKLSATAFLELLQEEMREEQTTSAEHEKSEQHFPSSPTNGLKHLDGVTSMVFFNSSGGVQAFINVKSSKEKDLLHNIDRQLQEDGVIRNTASVGIDSIPSRTASNGACLFNTTHCDCIQENRGEAKGDCYETFESKEETGRVLCLRKMCPPAYKCSCDGVEKCRRVDRLEEIYVPHTKEVSTEIYCTVEKRLVSKIVPVTSS